MSIQELAEDIKNLEVRIEEYRSTIKNFYDDNSEKLAESSNVITPVVQDNYKKIDAAFDAKGKLEVQVLIKKKQILAIALGE